MKVIKRTIACLSSIILFSFMASAQTLIYDGETIKPDFWDIGGNPPNGASCLPGEGWRLDISGKVDLLTEGLSNPYPSGLNTTEKVVRSVRAVNGEGWAGAALNVSALNLNINVTNKFSVLVYKEIEGNVTMKLEGAGDQEMTAYYNTPGEWQKLEFTFDAGRFGGSPTTLLVFPHNQTGLTETILTYWDEVTMYDASNNPTVIYNGNDPVSGFFIDGYPGPNGWLNDLCVDVFPNLSKAGINKSDHVLRFLRAKDGLNWCGIGHGGLNIDVSATPIVSIMINKSVTGRVGVKLEGAGDQEVHVDYTTPNQWAKLTFTFDPSRFTGNPHTIVVFPHFEETNNTNLAAHTPMYIDNVVLRNAATLSSDYFRSATSGNWNDNSSWESSYNNIDWVAATAVPDAQASSITIQNDHLITIVSDENASNITVSPIGKLTLNEGKTLSAETLNIHSNVDGTGTFVNKGTANITTSNVQQYISSGRNWYMSSPVKDAASSGIGATTGNTVARYNEVDGTWPDVGATLNAGQGFIAVSPVSNATITFSGELNAGNQSFTLHRTDSAVAKRGFNLVGNPYPAYLNWESAVRTNVGPTMWYRTKSNGYYTFATYGAVSKVGTSIDGVPVTAHIPAMQGFWVRVNGAGSGSLFFDNTMLTHRLTNNVLKAPASEVSQQQVLRLQVSEGQKSDETIILFNPNATNGYDDYDSPKMSNNNDIIPEIYSMVGNDKLVINGLNNLYDNTELALGFSAGQTNTYTIKATQISNFDENIQIQLIDKLLHTTTDLSNANGYTFSSESVNASDRFAIKFKNTSISTGLSKNPVEDINCIVNNRQLTIQSSLELDNDFSITVYTVSGQTLLSEKLNSKTIRFQRTLAPGIYVLKLSNSHKSYYKKFIL